MSKIYTRVGYAHSEEVAPGKYEDVYEEHWYYADVLTNARRTGSASRIVSDYTITNSFSIVADPFAKHNYDKMVYIEFQGVLWEVSIATIDYPRITINVGGVYNGRTA